ncbi:MAG: anhydro-N-acetylmuramic acid kinase [Polaribacter sp.]
MEKNEVFAIGIMSGTSLDGIDFVYIKFDKNNYADFKILNAKTIVYSNEWKRKLQTAISFSDEILKKLDIDYGQLLGEKTNAFIDEFNINKIDFITSHGHTILHQPDKGITLQVGNGQVIANITNQKIICDFRTQDVQLGGQGAPLVPIGDELLFSEYNYCLNLGGFANISFRKNNRRIAFDICPVNIVMNFYAEKLGFEYDDKGKIASEGNIHIDLLHQLNSLEFYQQKPPKSLGLEWVQQEVFPIIDLYKISEKDILRTFVEHIAIQITNQLEANTKILITGGGTFNDFLISRIKFLTQVEIIIPSKEIINFKEALVFAFLGVLRVENKVNCLKSVTGAREDHSSGNIFYPKEN